MTSLFTNYGYWDGKINTTNAPDKFTVTSTAAIADQFLYTCQTNLETAKIALDRVKYAGERANAFGATAEQLEELKDAARDVEMAIAAAIAKLTRTA